jgi:malate synthase
MPEAPPKVEQRMNSAPPGFNLQRDTPKGFAEFFTPLHQRFTPWQGKLIAARAHALEQSLAGKLPDYLPASEATRADWKIELPEWCADQRNQMTGPGDDAELSVKLLNSGSPGVMLDFEDSTANTWEKQQEALQNIVAGLKGQLNYFDKKRNQQVAVKRSKTVIWVRPRGLHMSQAGIFPEPTAAPLWDVANVVFRVQPDEMPHPLSIYIPKSESAEEAIWWRDLFQALAAAKGWPRDYIKAMALVEAHPMAYQMEEFIFNLRDHILGLNLGRWDYMASLIHFTLNDDRWVLPDRNTIPHDVPFFQNLRTLMPDICHKRGIHAVGGMTALFPDRGDPELNARALKVLAEDKKNEANCLMDGAWTGHPDQNEIAVAQFPYPNQLNQRPRSQNPHPDLRPVPEGVGKRTLAGTRAAVRTVIRYRNGVLNGKGASLLDGYMEDLATDRIYRLMIAQRQKRGAKANVLDDSGKPVLHTPELIAKLFDEELERILRDPPKKDLGTPETFRKARQIGEAMIVQGHFDPI